jgi:hypothetical protein
MPGTMPTNQSEVEFLLNDFQRLVNQPLGKDLLAEVKAHQEKWRIERLGRIQGEWHNRLGGYVAIVGAAALLMTGALFAYLELSASTFDVLAKGVVLFLAAAGSIALLKDDPFHHALPPDAGHLVRVKAHGKIVAAFAVVGFFWGVLDLIAAVRASEDADAKVVARVKESIDQLTPSFDALKRRTDSTLAVLASVKDQADALTRNMSDFDAKLLALRLAIAQVIVDLPSLATKQGVRDATSALATGEEVTRATSALATGEEVTRATSALATATQLADAARGLASASALETATKDLVTKEALRDATKDLSNLAALEKATKDLQAAMGSLVTEDKLTAAVGKLVDRDALAKKTDDLVTQQQLKAAVDLIQKSCKLPSTETAALSPPRSGER